MDKKDSRKKRSKPTIGTDMEFGIIDKKTNEIVSAGDLLRGNREAEKYKVGWDGHATTGEMRVDYSISGNLDRTYNAIKEGLKCLNRIVDKDIAVIGGCATNNSVNEPLGGHIHFGLITKEIQEKMIPRLDLYLALPLLMLENPQRAITRRKNSSYSCYGTLGDAKRKSEHQGFEYRTPSAWILSPGITKSALALADIILKATLKDKLPVFFNVCNEANSKFLGCEKDFFRQRKVVDEVFRRLFRFSYSEKYRVHLMSLKSLIDQKKEWLEEDDILPRWGLRPRPFIIVNHRDVGCDAIVADLLSLKLRKTIYIYGISKKREDVDVALYGDISDEVLDKIKKDYGKEVKREVFGSIENRSSNVKVGFSQKMRKNDIDTCKEIFKEIVSFFERKREKVKKNV